MRSLSVAAACCAHLLRGCRVSFAGGGRPRVPAIVVSEATQKLVCEVFERPAVFHGQRRIDRRVVAWGAGAEAVELPHAAVLISEEELVARLQPGAVDEAPDAEWRVIAGRPLPEGVVEHAFGSRMAWAVAADFEEPACWVESLEAGWLFLIPGWLIAVGGAPDALLGRSRVVAGQIRGTHGEIASFPAYPRIADPLSAPGWLACGSAAMAFDPICGDGTGNAVREAILASAVIRAAGRGEAVDGLMAHYRSRLIAGFRRHLEMSLGFYRAGNGGAWWMDEIRALEHGIAWCSGELAATSAFRYRLQGFDLERLE